jgi:hypothetical protein
MSSLALAIPMTLLNFWVPPALQIIESCRYFHPGIMAREVSGSPRREDFVATLISQLNASSSPPPRAGPSIQAITGTGKC